MKDQGKKKKEKLNFPCQGKGFPQSFLCDPQLKNQEREFPRRGEN